MLDLHFVVLLPLSVPVVHHWYTFMSEYMIDAGARFDVDTIVSFPTSDSR